MIEQAISTVSQGLGSLLSLVPTPGKLTIIPVSKFSPTPKPASPYAPYIAMYNPEHWEIQENFAYNTEAALGMGKNQARHKGKKQKSLSFSLTVDGTGAGGKKREVFADLAWLKTVIGFNGDEHQTNRLIIIWGPQIFSGVYESLSVKYTLFRDNGTPLRAVYQLKFIEDEEPFTALKKLNLASSDLTHRKLVKDNDRLDLMCYNVYDDSRFYIEVANANDLTSFRTLPTSREMIFPPTEK